MSGAEPKEESEKFNNCINVPNQRTVELLNEIEELKEENRKLKEEVRGMKEKRDDLTEETSLELHEWMQDEVTDLKSSFKELMKHTLEIYQRLLEKGISMAKGRSTAERTQLKIEVQKLDDLREKIYTETKKKNQESIRTIKNHLGNPKEAMADNEAECLEKTERAEEKEQEIVKIAGLIPEIGKMCEKISRDGTASREEKADKKTQRGNSNNHWTLNLISRLTDVKVEILSNERQLQIAQENKKLIQPFLGNFVWKCNGSTLSIEILYNEKTGYYEDKYTIREYPSLNRTNSWIPDGVERDGVRATIEGIFLVVTDIRYTHNQWKYELWEKGIRLNDNRCYQRK